jgi:Zn-dependent M28 family amino/carboxypeptidase
MFKNIIIILLISVFLGCSKVPEFDADNAFSYLEKQCSLGERYPGSAEILLCRELIKNIVTEFGASIKIQEFTALVKEKEYKGENIIARFYPQMSRRILLGAHYDTRPWADKDPDPKNYNSPITGANDAGSGVAVLLEIARVISEYPHSQFGIDLVFFDLEDMGIYKNNESWCLGSTYFAENFRGEKPEKAIILDMIGDTNLNIEIEWYSYHNSPNLVNEIWNAANELEFTEFKFKVGARIYDDHYPLIKNGFNAIDIIDFDYKPWHTLEDTPDKCSPHSLYVVGQTLLRVIYLGK